MENWNTLINFKNIPNNIISGLSGCEIENLAKNSMAFYENEKFVNLDEKNEVNFKDIDENILEEIRKLEESAKSKSTESQTKMYVQKLDEFLKSQNILYDLKAIPTKYLAQYIRWFYSQLKKKMEKYTLLLL